jgi:hypothetical protein
VAVLLCALVGLFAAPAHGEEQDTLIDKALSQSGIAAQVESLPAAVIMAVPGDVYPDSKTRDAVVAAFKKATSKEALLAPIREALRNDYREEMLEKVTAFYESRTGKKVSRIESRGLAPDLLRTIREGRKTAVSMDDARLNLLRRLIKADEVGKTNAVLVAMLIKGLFHGASAEATGEKSPDTANSQELSATSPADSSRTEGLALVGYAHTFRSLDEKELEELATFRESEAGVWFQERVLKGLQETVTRVGASLGEALQKAKNE